MVHEKRNRVLKDTRGRLLRPVFEHQEGREEEKDQEGCAESRGPEGR